MKTLVLKLRFEGIVFVPSMDIVDFILEARNHGITPNGGAMATNGQFFYL